MKRRLSTYRSLGVVASSRRQIRSGIRFDGLFPKPFKKDPFLTYLGTTYHTLDWMKKIVQETAGETKKIAQVLKGATLEETCRNIWHFLYHHYQYKMDKPNVEELRSPARAWSDRISGIDCDCYSISASSILWNLKIGHVIRKAKYDGKDYFQHVYIIVPRKPGLNLDIRSNYYVIDPVLDKPDFEKKYSEKFDKPMMPIRYLNGIEEDGLGKAKKVKAAPTTPGAQAPTGKKKKPKTKVGKVLKKAGNVAKAGVKTVAKATAVTAGFPIREGLKIAMKINFNRIAEKLGYGYWDDATAKAKGLDPSEHAKIKKSLAQVQKIWQGLAGQQKVLKDAIITGWKLGVKKHHLLHGFSGLGCGCTKNMGARSTIDLNPGFKSTTSNGSTTTTIQRVEPFENGTIIPSNEQVGYIYSAMGILNGIEKDLGDDLLEKLLSNRSKESIDGLGKGAIKKITNVVKKTALAPITAPVKAAKAIKNTKGGVGKKLFAAAKASSPTHAVVQALAPQKPIVKPVQLIEKVGKSAKKASKKATKALKPAANPVMQVVPVTQAAVAASSAPALVDLVQVNPLPDVNAIEEQYTNAVVDELPVDQSSVEESENDSEVEDFTSDAEEVVSDAEEQNTINGLMGLGEPVTLAAGTTAAAAVIAKITSLIKGVNGKRLEAKEASGLVSNLVPKGKKGKSKPTENSAIAPVQIVPIEESAAKAKTQAGMVLQKTGQLIKNKILPGENDAVESTEKAVTPQNSPVADKSIFTPQNIMIGAGALAIAGYFLFKNSGKSSLNGIGRNNIKKAKNRTQNKKVETIKI